MNGLNVFGLTAVALVLLFAMLRVERRALWVVLVLLVLPGGIAIGRWASVGGHWGETALALAIALPLTLAWWLAIGRRLPAPTSDSIKVWGRDKVTKMPPEETAALRQEVVQLKAEAERLQAEVSKL